MSDEPRSTSTDVNAGVQCVPNISLRERRKRLAFGGVAFAVGLVVLALLMAIDAGRWWRLVLFPLFWGAAVGFFQWQDET